MQYKFDKNRCSTKSINENLPGIFQAYIWNKIDQVIASGKELNSVQKFNLKKDSYTLVIAHIQESPEFFENTYTLVPQAGQNIEEGEVYVVDEIDRVIMRWSYEQ